VAYKIQTGSNKIKLLTGYENVTQNVLIVMELTPYNAKPLQDAHLYFIVYDLRFIVHGNTIVIYNHIVQFITIIKRRGIL
jgi:hypothetical protein